MKVVALLTIMVLANLFDRKSNASVGKPVQIDKVRAKVYGLVLLDLPHLKVVLAGRAIHRAWEEAMATCMVMSARGCSRQGAH
jgi:hypothetical protein